jgi:peroxiredoxin
MAMSTLNLKRFPLTFALLACIGSGQAAEPGKAAPNCQLGTLAAGPGKTLADYRGQVLYVDFWASWCGPCAQSFPHLNRLHQDLKAQGLQVVAVNMDENPADAKAFLARHPAEFEVLSDAGGQCATEFGVKAMPSSYLIDRQGVIRQVHLGFRPGEAQQFRAQVEQLIHGAVHASAAGLGAE